MHQPPEPVARPDEVPEDAPLLDDEAQPIVGPGWGEAIIPIRPDPAKHWHINLARAVVAEAVMDYCGDRPMIQAEAATFLFGKDPEWVASRQVWCQIAGLSSEPADLRRYVDQYLESKNPSQPPSEAPND